MVLNGYARQKWHKNALRMHSGSRYCQVLFDLVSQIRIDDLQQRSITAQEYRGS